MLLIQMFLRESLNLCFFTHHLSIKPSNLEDRKRVWAKLSSLLTTYSNLYLEDQVFLLEVRSRIVVSVPTLFAFVHRHWSQFILDFS